MEEQSVYIDAYHREWTVGSVQEPIVVNRLIVLPIYAKPMYPTCILDPAEDYLYSVCAKCEQPIRDEAGLVAVQFSAIKWGIRIVCMAHEAVRVGRMCAVPIILVQPILKPIIEEAFIRDLCNCVVCDRPNCTDETCQEVQDRGILFKNRIDELMTHFFRSRLDIVSPLLNRCETCGELIDSEKIICRECGLVFCCRECKKRKKHKCNALQMLYL